MRPTLRLWLAPGLALLVLTLSASGAAAVSIVTALVSFPGVTLDGTSQTVTGSTSAWRSDATGEAGGWRVTISSTDLINGASKTIDVSNIEARLLDSNIVRISGDTNLPTSSQTTYTSLSGSALKIATAAVGEADGVYDLTPGFRLTVPAEAYSGTYNATLTVDINVGP